MGQRTQPPSCVTSVTRNCLTVGEEEGGADVKSAWSLCPGLHTCYNAKSNEHSELARVSKSLKPSLSGDCRLKLACMNVDLVVIAGQLYCGEYVLASCTHRPSSQQSREYMNLAVLRGNMFSAMRVKS